jgi:hypothetical protein
MLLNFVRNAIIKSLIKTEGRHMVSRSEKYFHIKLLDIEKIRFGLDKLLRLDLKQSGLTEVEHATLWGITEIVEEKINNYEPKKEDNRQQVLPAGETKSV